ncbi:hypothetical protein MRB53_023490 [Persea americana]|uniref:Uncharacterized protein n=1 Tax=Persea americana TaxID=3435 RepID=A0ACC2LAQ2_PERAE|nr:hypothetical protein MRB53_023490 [Persea americana]
MHCRGFKAVSNRGSFFGQFVREILGGSVKLDAERAAGASRPFQTEPRSSGRTRCRGFKAVSNRASFFGQFVREILGGSVKLDAVILISHKSLFGYALCKGTHCRGFKAVSNRASFFGQFVREILGGSVKLDAVILISHKSLFGYALCKGTHCRGFKAVSNRGSFFGQFVREILGESVKLDAVILISHKSLFGYALCKAL